MGRGVKAGGVRNCRYEHDVWVGEDQKLYLKLTAIEFERATEETFQLTAKRRMREALQRMGLEPTWANGRGQMLVWDIARDWASDLVEAVTYVTREPLPSDALADEVL